MNRRMIIYQTGQILKAEALFLLLPLLVSLLYRESAAVWFLPASFTAGAVGFALTLKKPSEIRIYARDGFATVALAWVLVSLIGSMPYFLSGEIPTLIDSIFETISGFTTTGSTILESPESLSKGLLFWRGFTHWIGGMGVLVFVMAMINLSDGRSMHIMRAEAPGPIVGKLVPKLADTAKILYAIYIALTFLEVVLLLFGGMPLFDSIVHSFATAGTGGFSTRNMSIMAYDSAYIHVVITVFMLLCGINFNVFYLILLRRFGQAFKSEELRWYLGVIAVSILIITPDIYSLYGNVWISLENAAFQVVSVITTTGFAASDSGNWPELAHVILIGLMFFGACSGSTGGGLKISRILLLAKTAKRGIRRMTHPQAVTAVRLEGKAVNDASIEGLETYFVVYMALLAFTIFLLSFDKYNFETVFTAAVSHINNIGPVYGEIGPLGNMSGFSVFSKIVLCFIMLLGRLEIFPLLLTLNPALWRRRR